MKHKIYVLLFFLGILLFPQNQYAQVDFNKKPNDDLGDTEDAFQESFFEALKQKGIENYDRSVTALLKCIELDDSQAVLYYELGKDYIQLKNFGAAEDALKTAVNKDPDNEWYMNALYNLYRVENDLDKALKTLKDLAGHHPSYRQDLVELYITTKKYNDALKLLDELDAQKGISPQRDYLRNQIYAATGKKKEQIKNLEQRIDNNPDNESNYLALIYRYSENNEKEKAYETAKELLKINPNSQLVHLALYKFYLDDNDTEKAIESMKIVIKSPQIKPEAKLKVLSDFVKFVGDHPEYEPDLVEATTLVQDPNVAKSITEIAQHYLTQGDKEKALKYFEQALALEPENFSILRTTLLLNLDLKHYKLVLDKSNEALQKYPAQPILYLLNGVALNELQKPNEAIDILEAGLDYIIDDPKMESDVYNQLSISYTMLNNTAKAQSFSAKAKQLKTAH
ncbi:cytochrome c biosynthesis protein [Yeosuana aromativorans]|uniref:Cytochrome c biosynthesis protein n=1 Tax=Yeosuana aromativorans TaxID=288019 RepID=A0A8J3BUV5_9FLAO|nr:tetratricopeptide repeat protein [Yeosuana aromativorans]GGK30931.1 cytochrome c biosynthesis protein [Yeosuana aromativorans]